MSHGVRHGQKSGRANPEYIVYKQGRSYHWGLGGQGPPPIGLAPPPMIFVIVQYSLIAIAKILLLNAVNGRFDSYAKMYFVSVALQLLYILLSRKY